MCVITFCDDTGAAHIFTVKFKMSDNSKTKCPWSCSNTDMTSANSLLLFYHQTRKVKNTEFNITAVKERAGTSELFQMLHLSD